MRASKKKAQIALEFLLLAGFFLLVFLIMVAYFASMQRSEITGREHLLGREITLLVADHMHAALLGGKGHSTTFTLPPTLAGSEYQLYITNRTDYETAYVEIKWGTSGREFEYATPLATRNLWTQVLITPICDDPAPTSPCVEDGVLPLEAELKVKIVNYGDGKLEIYNEVT